MFPAAASHADVRDGHWGAPVKPQVHTHREALIPKRADVLAVRISSGGKEAFYLARTCVPWGAILNVLG